VEVTEDDMFGMDGTKCRQVGVDVVGDLFNSSGGCRPSPFLSLDPEYFVFLSFYPCISWMNPIILENCYYWEISDLAFRIDANVALF
jgi:hypothetical protein